MRDTKFGNKGERKKLSWIYKKKAKQQRFKRLAEQRNDPAQQLNKKARIIVRNLPFKATEQEVRQFYEKFGEIEEINLLKRPDGNPVGCGFIQFKHLADASKAIFNTNKKEFLGRVIHSSWAISKSKFCEKLQKELDNNAESKETIDHSILNENEKPEESEPKEQVKEEKDEKIKKNARKKITPELKRQNRKLHKEKLRKKRARVVIRNLSFQATEEDLREHFSKYGGIEEISILTRSDGKRVGCAFIQFAWVQAAAKAIHHANMQPIRGRCISVDWAIPKNKFCKDSQDAGVGDTAQVKVEKESDLGEIKEEKDSDVLQEDIEELGSGEERDKSSDSAESDADDDQSSRKQSRDARRTKVEANEDEDEDLSEDDDEIDKQNDDEEAEEEKETKRPRVESHDVAEGKTVFLKNVPFSVKNEELKQFIEQFGPVYYALVCIDPLTEHSKGTAFVKFKNLEDAEKCLNAGEQLRFKDQIMEAHKALERNEVENRAALKKYKERDSRNLYLVKEGVVLAGSPAAAGVSSADMAKRLQLEQWKSQILRNLNMFVSRGRLVVHNLPPTLDDAMLRKIFERHGNPNAIIREARVMRDLKNVDAKGVGKSKEYGFVSYTKHEDALKALRAINNNPNIFSNNKRPIVAFSIENRIMVNAKQRRIEKSREKNPLWLGDPTKREGEDDNKKERPAKRFKSDNKTVSDERTVKKSKHIDVEKSLTKPFAGMEGKPGENKLRSKFKLKTQAALHHQTLKKEKKMSKSAKKLELKRKQAEAAKREVKPKQGTKINPDDVHFAKLVNNYKEKLQSIASTRSKWYET